MKNTTHRLGTIGSKKLGMAGANAPAKTAGFTLIELMVVVAIVAVLLIVGLPAYQDQIIRSHRAAAKSEMLDVANRQHQFMLANRTFASKATLEANGYTLDVDVGDHYTYDISTLQPASAPFFTITFTPTGRQADDGDLTFNSQGLGTRAGEAELW
jgi:type IV pilus assembly protein PilE